MIHFSSKIGRFSQGIAVGLTLLLIAIISLRLGVNSNFKPKITASVSKVENKIYRLPKAIPLAKKDASPSSTSKVPDSKATPSGVVTTPHLTGFNVPIVMYHYVGNNPNPKDLQRDVLSITPDKFESQMQYLSQNGYTPINLDTLYGILNKKTPSPKKPIVLTFDDGYIDFYTTAFPILSKFSFHATEFIPTGLMDQGYYLSWSQIKQMQSSGLINFEAHTIHHANLPTLSYPAMLEELRQSKIDLEAKTGYPVNFIAYPYGAVNSTVTRAAQEAGFVGGLGTWFGKASYGSLDMPRIRITGNIALTDFIAKISNNSQ